MSYPLACTVIKGHTPTLVFLHGLGGTRRYWSAVEQALPTFGHRAMLVDLLGFGDSPKPWFTYTVARHVDALHSCLRDAGDIWIVGHSMGAALAMNYAARHPEHVRGLCLMSLPNFAGIEDASRWLGRSPGGWIYTNIAATALACVLTRRVAGWMLPKLLRSVPTSVAEDLVKHHVMSATTSLWEVLYRNDLAASAAAIDASVPVSLIHGGLDTTAPIANVMALAASRSGWEFSTLRNADHHPWLREPLQCTELIRRWLEPSKQCRNALPYRAPRAVDIRRPDNRAGSSVGRYETGTVRLITRNRSPGDLQSAQGYSNPTCN